MRRAWLLVVAAICIAGSAVCAYMARPPAPGALEVVHPVYDVGEVGQGETKAVQFELVNHSSHTLVIKDVATTCSCTDVEVVKREVAAGESTQLKATWRTGASRGAKATDLTVLFAPKDGPDERIGLRVQGNVAPDMVYRPERLEFEKGTAAAKSVAFSPGRLADGAVKKAWCSHRCFSATVGEGASDVTVTFDPSKWTADDDNLPPASVGLLQVETTSPHEPICRIPLVVRDSNQAD